MKFESIAKEEAQYRIEQRMNEVNSEQDRSFPNIGSLCSRSNPKIMNFLKNNKVIFKHKGICLSSKKNNWIINKGQGTFSQAIEIINLVKFLHLVTFNKCEIEARIWK